MGDEDGDDVLYRHDSEHFMPLVVRVPEHTSGVAVESISDDEDISQMVPVFRDELLPVARALIRAHEEGGD